MADVFEMLRRTVDQTRAVLAPSSRRFHPPAGARARAPRRPGALVPYVVIPLLEEAAALLGLLSRIPAGYRSIVVDNVSTDAFGSIAASWARR